MTYTYLNMKYAHFNMQYAYFNMKTMQTREQNQTCVAKWVGKNRTEVLVPPLEPEF